MEHAAVAAILEKRSDGALAVRAALHKKLGRLPDLNFSHSLAAGLPAERALLLTAGAAAPTQSQIAQGISSGLVVPLRGLTRRLREPSWYDGTARWLSPGTTGVGSSFCWT